ncbi:hypothetical protein [Rossellomorea marisflavi]|uniref:hypothetical protein n=1 Tax=Rossellomorea marisflavi TaxID=189381 RepID=UPI003F9F3864
MEKTRERWQEIYRVACNGYDYMEPESPYALLKDAMEQEEPLSKDNYETAFDELHKNVMENYVHSPTPETDPFEETYHFLRYFELEKDKEVPYFGNYLKQLKTELRKNR